MFFCIVDYLQYGTFGNTKIFSSIYVHLISLITLLAHKHNGFLIFVNIVTSIKMYTLYLQNTSSITLYYIYTILQAC